MSTSLQTEIHSDVTRFTTNSFQVKEDDQHLSPSNLIENWTNSSTKRAFGRERQIDVSRDLI